MTSYDKDLVRERSARILEALRSKFSGDELVWLERDLAKVTEMAELAEENR